MYCDARGTNNQFEDKRKPLRYCAYRRGSLQAALQFRHGTFCKPQPKLSEQAENSAIVPEAIQCFNCSNLVESKRILFQLLISVVKHSSIIWMMWLYQYHDLIKLQVLSEPLSSASGATQPWYDHIIISHWTPHWYDDVIIMVWSVFERRSNFALRPSAEDLLSIFGRRRRIGRRKKIGRLCVLRPRLKPKVWFSAKQLMFFCCFWAKVIQNF